jgi:hypothetical protein
MRILERFRNKNQTFERLGPVAALGRNPLPDINRIIENVPIAWIQQGRTSKKDILTAQSHEYNPNRIATKIREADLALAATTPVLGQYAPTFGWPESQ